MRRTAALALAAMLAAASGALAQSWPTHGTIAAGVVAKSTPDGHNLILVPSTHGTARALYESLPYEAS